MRISGRPFYYFAVALLLAAAVAWRLADPFPVQALRLIGFDFYQRLAPAAADPQSPVVVVDIDEASLQSIGQWPWPRTRLADMAQRLAADGAAAIVFDMLFSEADQSSPEEVVKRLDPAQAAPLLKSLDLSQSNDQKFAAALAATPSVLGLSLSGYDRKLPGMKSGFAVAGDDPSPFLPDFRGAISNLPVLNEAARGLGSINWIEDRDLVVRRVPLVFHAGDQYVPSLAAEALRVAQGAGSYLLKASNASGEEAFGRATGLNHIRIGDVAVPTDPDGAIWLRFRPSDPSRFIPAKSVLDGSLAPERVAGRIVLVGTSAAGLLDLRATPIDSAVPGVEIHEQILEHILAGRTLTRPDFATGIELFAMVLAGLLVALLLPRLPPALSALLGVLAAVAVLAGGFLAFDRLGLLFDPLYPLATVLVVAIGSTLYTYRETERARAGIRQAFQFYVSPQVVDEIIADPARLELGGELRELTLLFCDVRSFTTLSEGLSATELTRFVNELLTPLSDIILRHRGTIDKYMGDAIMAFWNAPLDDPDHASNALAAANAMQAAMPALNEAWQARARETGGTFPQVRIGIGLNTGLCCVGNLGSSRRFDYSAIGDEVNVASRLEELTKTYGLGVVMSEATWSRAGSPEAIEIDRVKLRGRTAPTRLYAPPPEGASAEFAAAHSRFRALVEAGDTEATQRALLAAQASAPSRFSAYYPLMLQRLEAARDASSVADRVGGLSVSELQEQSAGV